MSGFALLWRGGNLLSRGWSSVALVVVMVAMLLSLLFLLLLLNFCKCFFLLFLIHVTSDKINAKLKLYAH